MIEISRILEKMITYSEGNIHDIDHFLHVWAYARMIGELEGVDKDTQFILEVAAVTHDIACPLCRKKYGNTEGKNQEKEGEPLVRVFLSDAGMTQEQIDRVAFLVGHHHTYTGVDGIDYQILLEADYIVNAIENRREQESIRRFRDNIAKTETGKRLITEVLLHTPEEQ